MKKIGILGGMSPESTALYYEHIIRTYTARFGDYGYPEILIYSVNFQKFVDWQHQGQWHEAARAMAGARRGLSWDARRYRCWCNRNTVTCPSSTPHVCTPRRHWISPCEPQGEHKGLTSDACQGTRQLRDTQR